jgi:hypothetical protein
MRRLGLLLAAVVLAACGNSDPAVGRFVTPTPVPPTPETCAHALVNRAIAEGDESVEPLSCQGLPPVQRQRVSDLLVNAIRSY